jgi:hypothetical protein
MAFDQSTRKRLADFVNAARDLITDEFTQKFAERFGISDDGTCAPLEKLTHLDEPGLATAALLRERIDYLVRSHPEERASRSAAVKRLAREQAFTVLNRLAALRMAEKRELILESVGRGYQSKGFKLYETVAGTGMGETYERYRRYLFCLFDELAVDLGVLFDRHSPHGRLFLREPAMVKLLDLLNAADLDSLWAEDETIGWIYQYYNGNEVSEMRKAANGGPPRNSRELAVRNQFFTPRYVVEFLTDNTLGRLWYEMTRGETALRDRCRYLVRRPTEIFLKSGESAPESALGREVKARENLSQEELLRQPVYIPHRALKDPREIRLLDPACGSMHFGLYAFDLFTVIYDEAWEIAHGPDDAVKSAETFAPFVTFVAAFPDKAAFLREVPRLIVEHNIHGIDIDPRAAQIAGLSLWLRAQRAWHQAGVKPADRPRITRSNLVCAEPMPGEKELLREFVEQQFPTGERPTFAFLLETVFDRMTLAGEAGSLLRIEEEIRAAIAEAKRLWKAGPTQEQTTLFPEAGARPGQGEMRLDLSGITDEQFWERAEQRIYDSLAAYSEQAESGGGFRRRLFADDAAQGFAFIALSRKRYDVVVMNPPFGDTTDSTRAYVSGAYEWRSKNLLCAFVARGRELAIYGAVGAITDATWLKKADYDDFRRFMLSEDNRLSALCDLGWGVLDGANVASCCFASIGGDAISSSVATIRLVDVDLDRKGEELLKCLCSRSEPHPDRVFIRDIAFFKSFPGRAIAYEIPDSLIPAFREWPSLEPTYGITRRGYTPGDTFRFFRCWWEVAIRDRNKMWWPLNNGGAFAPVIGDGLFVALYENDWRSYRSLSGFRLESEDWFGRPGLGWGKRTDFMYAYPLPRGSMFSNEGHCAFPTENKYLLPLLAYLNSSVGQSLLNLFCGQHKLAGYVSELPTPDLDDRRMRMAGEVVSDILRRFTDAFSKDETFENFLMASGPRMDPTKMSQELAELSKWYEAQLTRIDDLVVQCLPGSTESTSLELDLRPKPAYSKSLPQSWFPEILSFATGCVFGRWDIRYSTGERTAPELHDPFGALPICPAGILQGDDGLPISPEAGRRLRTEGRYPLDVAWDGILVDDREHPLDIERRVQEALAVLWGDRAGALEHEACALLGVPTLREWFRRPSAFFADHLKRYSKSRRQAPIYWPLSTRSGSYTLWLYYHRLSEQTLHAALSYFLEPKIKAVDAALASARAANRTREVAEHQDFLEEIHEFKAELERLTKLPWKPNLNDGVLITAASLWKLFRHGKWQKDLKGCWEELERGDYDWAHLAHAICPKRVEEKCKSDRSLAIAHGLEHLCQVEPPRPKSKRRAKAKGVTEEMDES